MKIMAKNSSPAAPFKVSPVQRKLKGVLMLFIAAACLSLSGCLGEGDVGENFYCQKYEYNKTGKNLEAEDCLAEGAMYRSRRLCAGGDEISEIEISKPNCAGAFPGIIHLFGTGEAEEGGETKFFGVGSAEGDVDTSDPGAADDDENLLTYEGSIEDYFYCYRS